MMKILADTSPLHNTLCIYTMFLQKFSFIQNYHELWEHSYLIINY